MMLSEIKERLAIGFAAITIGPIVYFDYLAGGVFAAVFLFFGGRWVLNHPAQAGRIGLFSLAFIGGVSLLAFVVGSLIVYFVNDAEGGASE